MRRMIKNCDFCGREIKVDCYNFHLSRDTDICRMECNDLDICFDCAKKHTLEDIVEAVKAREEGKNGNQR